MEIGGCVEEMGGCRNEISWRGEDWIKLWNFLVL